MPAACPICTKPVTPEFRPFCSIRCRKVDLSRWLSESYVIPGSPLDPDEGTNSTPSRDEDD